ncbi:MAG: hypothetical protein E7327_03225 [Clostridiales bacterium]|nr:hypothetical protein [Clostridiales bacterium]
MLTTHADILEPILKALAKLTGQRILITIDGPCGSGKSTLAEKLSQATGAAVIHMDDFVIPHAQKTPERLSVPGGNADTERLSGEVLRPWACGKTVSFRKYLCHEDAYSEPETLPSGRYLIVEGTYSNLPAIAEHAGFRLFLTVTPQTQQRRLLQRVGPERIHAFNERWIPLENAYFAAYSLPDDGCMVIDTDQDHAE